MRSACSLLTILTICILGKGVLAQLLDERCRRRVTNCFGTTPPPPPPSYMAFITLNGKNHCGGSLISNRFVLTAKNCFIHDGDYLVELGVEDRHNVQTFGIDKRIPHSDLMLLKLDREVEYSVHIRPICIMLGPLEKALLNRSSVFIITGWRRISNAWYEPPSILQQAQIERIPSAYCGRPRGFICAEADNRYTCQDNSGDPLTVNFRYEYEIVNAQVGVLHGGQIGSCHFTQYVNVVHFTDWIAETITNNTITNNNNNVHVQTNSTSKE